MTNQPEGFITKLNYFQIKNAKSRVAGNLCFFIFEIEDFNIQNSQSMLVSGPRVIPRQEKLSLVHSERRETKKNNSNTQAGFFPSGACLISLLACYRLEDSPWVRCQPGHIFFHGKLEVVHSQFFRHIVLRNGRVYIQGLRLRHQHAKQSYLYVSSCITTALWYNCGLLPFVVQKAKGGSPENTKCSLSSSSDRRPDG